MKALHEEPAVLEAQKLLIQIFEDYTFFIDSHGHLACAYNNVLAGDLIVGLYGAVMPFVVRPHGPGQYQLISNAVYTPGDDLEKWRLDKDAVEYIRLM
jgi:hypothetical protein